MAEVDYTQMDGMQVLWHLLTTEPFFWGIILFAVGVWALGGWAEHYLDKDTKYYDDDRWGY